MLWLCHTPAGLEGTSVDSVIKVATSICYQRLKSHNTLSACSLKRSGIKYCYLVFVFEKVLISLIGKRKLIYHNSFFVYSLERYLELKDIIVILCLHLKRFGYYNCPFCLQF